MRSACSAITRAKEGLLTGSSAEVAKLQVDYETAQLKAGARLPLVLARIEQPAGVLYAEAAWGNPEPNLTFERPLRAPGELRLRGETRLAVGLPLAEDDTRTSQLEGRALALANALRELGDEPPMLGFRDVLGSDLSVATIALVADRARSSL